MLNKSWALALAVAVAAAPVSVAWADGGSAGSAGAGAIKPQGASTTGSPRATVGGSAAAPVPGKGVKRTSMGGGPELAGSGNSGSANARKSDSTSSQ